MQNHTRIFTYTFTYDVKRRSPKTHTKKNPETYTEWPGNIACAEWVFKCKLRYHLCPYTTMSVVPVPAPVPVVDGTFWCVVFPEFMAFEISPPPCARCATSSTAQTHMQTFTYALCVCSRVCMCVGSCGFKAETVFWRWRWMQLYAVI